MNICFVLSQREVTGAEAYAVSIADELIKRGHKVFIVSDTLTLKTRAHYLSLDLNNRSYINRLRHISFLIKLVKNEKIDLLHAHSRASGWVSFFASKISGIPLVTTVHGRQHLHISRKIIKAFGDYIIAICENIKEHLINDLNIRPEYIEILRNGIDMNKIKLYQENLREENLVTVAGRLSGFKGEIICYLIKEYILKIPNIRVNLVGHAKDKEKFVSIDPRINYIGFSENLPEIISKSSVLIGSGRIAIKGLCLGVPTIAIGEGCSHGLITEENIKEALKTNFGDIALKEYRGIKENPNFDFDKVKEDIIKVLKTNPCVDKIKTFAQDEFNLKNVVDRIETIYERLLRGKKEIPILMYHRVVRNKKEAGKEGIYITQDKFEWQMRYLFKKGYKTITFNEYKGYEDKAVILTFDDGYEDNYAIVFPILRKYNFKAVIFLVPGLKENLWDKDKPLEPRLKLLSEDQILEMSRYGFEFGSHSLTHPHLTRINEEGAIEEIFKSKEKLERLLKCKVISFAYPYGELNEKIKDIIRLAGYKYAVTTDYGPPFIDDDLLCIRRIPVFPKTGKLSFKHKIRGDYFWYKLKKKYKLKFFSL